MRGLSPRQALAAWERGDELAPYERPLALLAAALPESDPERLRSLPLGSRDALLFRLREGTFGRDLRGFARCPACAARLELDIDSGLFPIADALERSPRLERLEHDGVEVVFRLPDSTDFAAMGACADVDLARALLLERCVHQASDTTGLLAAADLPPTVVAKLGERMEGLDPMADLPLAIECAACGHGWNVVLDIAAMMWREVADLALRLLDDVQQLARGYGWSEAEILHMSAARRRYYLSRLAPPDLE